MAEVQRGWGKNGIPGGKRLLREPEATEEYSFKTDLTLAPIYLFSLFYGIFINIKNALARLLWSKPVSLKGKVCFVTGSGRGVGRELVLELARKGAKVACADINEETNKTTIGLLNDLGATAKAYHLNVANRKEVFNVAEQVEKDLGPVYLVINNAAIVLPPPEPTEEYVRAAFNVNTLGPIWVADAFLPRMKTSGSGHIVNVCSITSYYPIPFLEVYSATKAALSSYTESLRITQIKSRSNVNITSVFPTFINSSADYTSAAKSSAPPVSLRTVVDSVIYAVEYKLDRVSIPITGILQRLFWFLPTEVFVLVLHMVKSKAILPTKEEYENLPIDDIIKSCWKEGVLKKENNG